MATKKRGHNEGTIYQRQDGRWTATINLGYVNGKRKRKSFYGKTKEDVRRELTKAQAGHDKGLNVAPERQTVGAFLKRWLEDVAQPSVRRSTYMSYEENVRLHLVPGLGRKDLQKLSAQDVQAFLKERLSSGLSPRSVQYLRDILRNALNQAMRWDLVARNVATMAQPPAQVRYDYQILTPEQAKAFLNCVRGSRYEAIYSVAVALGLRMGEALGLRWSDVDLSARTLVVQQQLQRRKGEVYFSQPKTKKGCRVIPLPGFAVTALKEHRARQLETRLAHSDTWQDSGLVFTDSEGGPVDESKVRYELGTILKKAELPKLRFHDLRHTCASLLLAQGVSPRVVMETLGHSSFALTMNTYSHVIPSLQRDAADQMESLLSNTA